MQSTEQQGGNSQEIITSINELINTVKNLLEISIGLLYALASFRIMVPAAISLAPGLIRAW